MYYEIRKKIPEFLFQDKEIDKEERMDVWMVLFQYTHAFCQQVANRIGGNAELFGCFLSAQAFLPDQLEYS